MRQIRDKTLSRVPRQPLVILGSSLWVRILCTYLHAYFSQFGLERKKSNGYKNFAGKLLNQLTSLFFTWLPLVFFLFSLNFQLQSSYIPFTERKKLFIRSWASQPTSYTHLCLWLGPWSFLTGVISLWSLGLRGHLSLSFSPSLWLAFRLCLFVSLSVISFSFCLSSLWP